MKRPLALLLLASSALGPLSACVPVMVGGGAATAASAIVDDRPAGVMLDDTSIKVKINNLYAQTDVNDLLPNVTVDVHQGRVMLTGIVNNEQTILRAVQLAWKVAGVREVINEIQLRSEVSFSRLGKDAVIANSVRTRLIATKGIHSANYMVECFNGVVYLLGTALTQTELDAANRVAATTSGTRKVVSHVKLKGAAAAPAVAPYQDSSGGIMAPETAPTQQQDNGGGWTETSPDEIAPRASGTPTYDDPYANDGGYAPTPVEEQPMAPVETGEVPDAY